MAILRNKKLRVGIIGCGSIAIQHMKAYMAMDDVEIVAGCDIVAGRAREFMDSFGLTDVKTDYKDHCEMLSDDSLALDAVSVCTYNRQHVPCAKEALLRGIHVLLEKPMCVTEDEAWDLYNTVKKTGLVLSVGFQSRYDRNMSELCEIVRSGVLGKIYYIQTGGGRRRGIPVRDNGNSFIRDETAGTGSLGDIGCYSLDMVLNALGYPKPLTVSGFTSSYFGKNPKYYHDRADAQEIADIFSVDDFSSAFIRFEGDLVIDFRIAWAMNMDTSGDTLIYGTDGGLRIPSTECWNGSIGGPMTLYYTKDGKTCEKMIPITDSGDGNKPYIWQGKIRSFLDACLGKAPTPAPVDEIILNQLILSGIAKSAKLGKEIEIDLSRL